MNTKIKWLAVLALVVGGGFYAYNLRATGPAIPGDMRDAVADSAVETLKKEAGPAEINTPDPKDVKAISAEPAGEAGYDELFSRLLGTAKETHRGGSPGNMQDRAAVVTMLDLLGKTPYEKMAELFDAGVPAVKEDLLGWHAGRAVFIDGTIEGALLIGRSLPNAEQKLQIFNTFYLVPEYYDKMPLKMVNAINKKMASEPKPELVLPEAKAVLAKGPLIAVIEVRRRAELLVERISVQNEGRPLGTVYSYYFKNVTPK
jgi:hypothetical protein